MLIEADMHCHSIASSHAYSTVKEMADFASSISLKAFALTDHAPDSPDAPHVWHFNNLKALPGKINGVYVIKGIEANIYEDGTIKLEKYHREHLEWFVASLHQFTVKGDNYGDFSDIYINVVKNHPEIDVIGHCNLSCYPFEYEKVLKTFKEYGKLVEINENSFKFRDGAIENCKKILEVCKKFEIPVIVNTDAHYCEHVGVTPLSERIISDINFPQELVVNRNVENILEMISEKRSISF